MHLALASLALALTPAAAQGASQDASRPSWLAAFPAASADLILEQPQDAPWTSLVDLVARYSELTGQFFVINTETRQILENTETGLHGAVTIPSAHVQPFFETMLIENDFVLKVLRDEAPRMLAVESLRTQDRNTVRGHARFVPRELLSDMRDHPAILVTTTVALDYSDVRQLSNSLRTMITDANTQQMLPAGNSNSLILTGFGAQVADLIELLERVDADSRVVWEQQQARRQEQAEQQGAEQEQEVEEVEEE